MMQLATADGSQPWVCNVWFAADEAMNIYWFSTESRRHSQEVEKNEKVGATVCLPQTLDDTPRAVQLEGIAKKLTDEAAITQARSVYEGRIFSAEKINQLIGDPDWPHHFYRIKPNLFVLYDAVHFPEVSRQEWRPN